MSFTPADVTMIRSLVRQAQYASAMKLHAAENANEKAFYSATLAHLADLERRLKPRNVGSALDEALHTEEPESDDEEEDET